MKELIYQRATLTYLLLVLVTAISFWLTVGHGSTMLSEGPQAIWTTVIVLAFIKVRWVLLDFMELRSAPITLRLLFEAWAMIVATALILTTWLVA